MARRAGASTPPSGRAGFRPWDGAGRSDAGFLGIVVSQSHLAGPRFSELESNRRATRTLLNLTSYDGGYPHSRASHGHRHGHDATAVCDIVSICREIRGDSREALLVPILADR